MKCLRTRKEGGDMEEKRKVGRNEIRPDIGAERGGQFYIESCNVPDSFEQRCHLV